jgi:hypothetical protein
LSSLQEAFFSKLLGSARRDHGDDESGRVFAEERSCFRTINRRRVRFMIFCRAAPIRLAARGKTWAKMFLSPTRILAIRFAQPMRGFFAADGMRVALLNFKKSLNSVAD